VGKIHEVNMPEPQDDESKKERSEQSPDMVEKIKQQFYEGQRIQAFQKGAGWSDEAKSAAQSSGKTEDVIVAASLKIVGDIVKESLQQITALQKTAVAPEKDSYYKELLKQLLEAQAIGRQTPDPWDAYSKMSAIMAEVTDKVAKQVALPNIPSQGIDPTKLLEIEIMKADKEERRLQHERLLEETKHRWHQEDQRYELEKAERERRWKQEDKKWEMEIDLKAAEIAGEKERKKQTQTQLTELLSAITAGIRAEPDYPGGPNTASQPQIQNPNDSGTFSCCNCGKPITPAPDAEQVICDLTNGGCGQVYDRKKD
jgi:hypothetical protein